MKPPARFAARIAPRLFIAILTILLIVQPALAGPLAKQGAYAPEVDTGPTTFDIYYGPSQNFGAAGQPQPQVNILGKVSDPDGFDISLVPDTLTFILNGGTEVFPLSLGPDTRRLYDAGEFNVELWAEDLNEGANTVVIKAKDALLNETTTTVTVNISYGSAPIPRTINWATVAQISDVAQVVDGKWSLGASGVRTQQIGYDRLIAIGDMDWTDYEITVPVTVHNVVPNGYQAPSFGPAVGLIAGWNGHTNSPICCTQPLEGYIPYGAIAAYRWEDDSGENDGLKLYFSDNEDEPKVDASGFTISTGVTYNFKVRIERVSQEQAFYRFKVWQASAVEPAAWNVSAMGPAGDPTTGSLLLQAHHVDATFGNVNVTQISDTVDPVITNIGKAPFSSSAVITWDTDEPSDSVVNYGQDTSYGDTVEDTTLVTHHTVTLTGLEASTEYHFTVGSKDQHNNSAVSTDQTFTTLVPGGTPGIDSDDFNACTLNTEIWAPANPLEDSTLSMAGPYTGNANLSIAVPAGTDHDMHASDDGGNRSPRIMQATENTESFELEAKFDSQVTTMYQMQGILVEELVNMDYLRFEIHRDETNVIAAVYKYEDGNFVDSFAKVEIPQGEGTPPYYMRVKRNGALWTFSYSRDGLDWVQTHSFSQALTVTAVGAYGANASGDSSPAHTALLDYFYNTAAPIANEDAARNSLTINKVGSGEVALDKVKDSYGCNELVTLTATPAPGYKFTGWSGDITGIANPLSTVANVVMSGSRAITATFTAEEYTLTVTQLEHGVITVSPVKAKYLYGDKVTLSVATDTNWALDNWVINKLDDGKANPLVYTIVGDTTISAKYSYSENKYTIDISNVKGQGTVSVTPASSQYAHGVQVKLTATPAPGWEFAGWSGSLESTDNPYEVTMTKNLILTATFTQLPKDNMIFIPVIVSE